MSFVWNVRTVMTISAVIALGVSSYAFIFARERLETNEGFVLLFASICSIIFLGRFWHMQGKAGL